MPEYYFFQSRPQHGRSAVELLSKSSWINNKNNNSWNEEPTALCRTVEAWLNTKNSKEVNPLPHCAAL